LSVFFRAEETPPKKQAEKEEGGRHLQSDHTLKRVLTIRHNVSAFGHDTFLDGDAAAAVGGAVTL
jgi:hypothetical protein